MFQDVLKRHLVCSVFVSLFLLDSSFLVYFPFSFLNAMFNLNCSLKSFHGLARSFTQSQQKKHICVSLLIYFNH
uniref:Putative ovule protein n=1 Tax=Solanum chacoense TaxID=4108 RepID=A0A0V0I902_SOLCH